VPGLLLGDGGFKQMLAGRHIFHFHFTRDLHVFAMSNWNNNRCKSIFHKASFAQHLIAGKSRAEYCKFTYIIGQIVTGINNKQVKSGCHWLNKPTRRTEGKVFLCRIEIRNVI